MLPAVLMLAVVMLVVLAAGEVAAQGIQVTIDRTEATVQDQLVLTVTVTGSQTAQPQLPQLPDFTVDPRGRSSQVNIINGQYTASLIYNYLLAPKRPGTFTIGAARVEIDGTIYGSRPFQVKIVAASKQPGEANELFITTQVSNRKPYVGQQVVYTWRFFRRVQIADAQLEAQEFNGFLVEDLGELREYRSVVGGKQYLVSELRKALFPQEEGTLQIPPSQVSCQVVVRLGSRRGSIFDDFFGRSSTQSKVVRSKPITIEVQPLPPPPAGFSGLVGSFDVSAKLSKRSLQVGESTTLNLTVSGSGNAHMISEPPLAGLESFKIYDDKPSGTLDRSGNLLSGYKTFTKALVPLQPGEMTVPAISLISFNPAKSAYETKRTGPFTLAVSPAEGQEELRLTESMAPGSGKVAVRILADDILPIERGLDAVAAAPLATRPLPLLVGALLAPPLLFLGLLIADRRQRRFQADAGLKKRRIALRTARRSLQQLTGSAGAEIRTVADLGSRCLRIYIGDKLGLEGIALTPKEVRQHLGDNGVTDELADEVHQLLERLEAAQYGAATVEAEQLDNDLKQYLNRLERQIKATAP